MKMTSSNFSYFAQKKSSFKENGKIFWTSLVGTSKILDAAKKISGAGFSFSKTSADTIASNLKKGQQNKWGDKNQWSTKMKIVYAIPQLQTWEDDQMGLHWQR